MLSVTATGVAVVFSAGADVLVGMFAGALAAVSSHPADVLLTRLCGTAGGASENKPGSSVTMPATEAGLCS